MDKNTHDTRLSNILHGTRCLAHKFLHSTTFAIYVGCLRAMLNKTFKKLRLDSHCRL